MEETMDPFEIIRNITPDDDRWYLGPSYDFDGWRFATDGHVALLRYGGAGHLPAVPRKLRDAIERWELHAYTESEVATARVREWAGEPRGPRRYGYIGTVPIDRSYVAIAMLLADDDETVTVTLPRNHEEGPVEFAGAGWRAYVMGLRSAAHEEDVPVLEMSS